MKILFLPRTPVDFEHMLPYMHLIKDKFPDIDQKFCYMDIYNNPFEHKDIKMFASRDSMLSPALFFKSKPARLLGQLLFKGEDFVRQYLDETIKLPKLGIRRRLFSVLWKKLESACSSRTMPQADIIFMSENNAATILSKKSFELFSSIIDVQSTTVILIPESYDAFTWQNGFDSYVQTKTNNDFSSKVYLFSRGETDKDISTLCKENNVVITGSLRYSYWWSKRLYDSSNQIIDKSSDKKSLTVLYLAQKKKTTIPGFNEVQEIVDKELINLVAQNSTVKMIIKPHPKGNHYKRMRFPNKVKNRISIVSNESTLALCKSADIVVSVWTTIIPSFLMLGKPAVFYSRDEFDLDHTFGPLMPQLTSICNDIADLNAFVLGTSPSVKKEAMPYLKDYFQFGQDHEEYINNLTEKLRIIFDETRGDGTCVE